MNHLNVPIPSFYWNATGRTQETHCEKKTEFSTRFTSVCWAKLSSLLLSFLELERKNQTRIYWKTGVNSTFSYSSWIIPWTEEPCRLQSVGSQRIGHDWVTNTFTCMTFSTTFVPFPPRRSSDLLQYSCWENPMDRGAWRATVHRVPNSWTWLSD